jgi:hypothetical protein
LEEQPAISRLEALEKGGERQSGWQAEGLRNKVHHGLGMDELVKLIKSKRAPAAVKVRASRVFIEVMMRAAGLWERA